MRDVVVTGVGAVSPLGVGAGVLHERWCAGQTGITGGLAACSEYDPKEHLSVKEARRADRCTQLVRVAAAEALALAGWADGELPYDPARIGSVIGTGIGGIGTLEDSFGVLRDRGPEAVGPLSVPLMMSNAPAAAISLRHGLLGPSFGVVSACAAGTHAIGTAMALIRSGAVQAVVTGGSEAAITPLTRAAFAAAQALSPTGVSRPFDARRDGFVLGEGAGVLVLEDAEAAAARGATVLARLTGYAATSDAHHLTAPPPDGRGAVAAMRGALADAGREPGEVTYVNAHGTSTPLNDRAESAAITEVLGTGVPVSSTKSVIGHLLGAAGAVEAVATVESLRRRLAGPTVGWEEREPGMDLDYVPDSPRPLTGDRLVALSNSFGFGGHNAVLCLEGA
jgi:3-oxoacyl-[acyl-carrier-protein] synthase II